MSDRSGCSLAELAVLEALDVLTAGRPRAYVPSAKVLAGIEERIGLGPRYASELLLDLARPWVIPVRTVAAAGNYGDRAFPRLSALSSTISSAARRMLASSSSTRRLTGGHRCRWG